MMMYDDCFICDGVIHADFLFVIDIYRDKSESHNYYCLKICKDCWRKHAGTDKPIVDGTTESRWIHFAGKKWTPIYDAATGRYMPKCRMTK